MSSAALDVAKLHQKAEGGSVEYLLTTAEDIALTQPGQYDIVTCLEMLEHVPDPQSIIRSCATLVKTRWACVFSPH